MYRITAPNGTVSHLVGGVHTYNETVIAHVRTLFNLVEPELLLTEYMELTKENSEAMDNFGPMPEVLLNRMEAILPQVKLSKDDSILIAFTKFMVGADRILDASRSSDKYLDAALISYAKSKGVETDYAESHDDNLNSVKMLTQKDMLESIEYFLTMAERYGLEYMIAYIHRHIIAGDCDAIFEELNGSNTAFSQKLCMHRDKAMAKRIAKAGKKQRCFVLVGASHIPGVIKHLEEAGYSVTDLRR